MTRQDQSHLLRGTLDLLILKALTWGPRHGYAILEWIEGVTDEALQILEGSIYPALHRMEKRGWIEASWGVSENNRRAKFYDLTAEGRRRLTVESSLWERYAAAMAKALAATSPSPA